jgi:protoporphyrinogen oxidase
MPIAALVRALRPRPSEPVERAGAGLAYRDLIVVALVLRAADLFPDNWIYVHSAGVQVARIQNFNNWSRDMVPTPDRTCLGLEYFCSEGDGLWSRSDEQLTALAARELGALGLADPRQIEDALVVRVPKAYPVYDRSYRAHLATIRRHIDPIANLHLVGRNGMHKYNNQDHSMLTAMMAVQNMQGGSHDLWSVNTDFEYHEEIRAPHDGRSLRRRPPVVADPGPIPQGAIPTSARLPAADATHVV